MMTVEQSWVVIYSVLIVTYVFGLNPLLGAMLGGNYSDYGVNNAYENCMGRGIIAHVVVGVIYIIFVAVSTV